MESIVQSYCYNVEDECQDIDYDSFLLKSKNTSDLLRIQDLVNTMEGRQYSTEQVLERIIGFYGKFISLNY